MFTTLTGGTGNRFGRKGHFEKRQIFQRRNLREGVVIFLVK